MARLVTGLNDLATVNPDLAAEWHPAKNAPLLPSQVAAGTKKKVWWKCHLGHEWEAAFPAEIREVAALIALDSALSPASMIFRP